MPRLSANDIELAYDANGSGEPLVLVHGGWSDRHNWQPVAGTLAQTFQVVAYDRRGHGRSERPADQGTRRDQEDDLAALIEGVGCAPAHVAGTSFGGSIALGLATRRPDLVRSVIVHEPPLMSLVAADPAIQPLLEAVEGTLGAVRARLVGGDVEGGARQFVEEIALGPGAWEMLPAPLRATMIDSAPAFISEQRDPLWHTIDTRELARIACPVLLTQGDASPAWFRAIVARLADATDGAQVHTYRGAGHAPHITHPDAYLEAVTSFLVRAVRPATELV